MGAKRYDYIKKQKRNVHATTEQSKEVRENCMRVMSLTPIPELNKIDL